jgi:hypothetical protein
MPGIKLDRNTLLSTLPTLLLALVALAVAPATTQALSFTDVIVESEVGSGANEAMIVIDWQAGTSPSHAWLFRWDGAATHEDAYAAIDVAEGSDFSWSGGPFVSFMAYADDDGDAHTTTNIGWLSFWSSGDGESWLDLQVGIGDEQLVDGGWAGANANLEVDGWPGEPPLAPLPEPGTSLLLGLGMFGLAVRPRRPTC